MCNRDGTQRIRGVVRLTRGEPAMLVNRTIKRGRLLFALSLGASAFGICVGAQDAPVSPGARTRPPVITSPEVLQDGRVVFRVFAPTASQVEVNTVEAGRFRMQKDSAGVWSVTTEVLS